MIFDLLSLAGSFPCKAIWAYFPSLYGDASHREVFVILDLFSRPDFGLEIGNGAFPDLLVGGLGDVF